MTHNVHPYAQVRYTSHLQSSYAVMRQLLFIILIIFNIVQNLYLHLSMSKLFLVYYNPHTPHHTPTPNLATPPPSPPQPLIGPPPPPPPPPHFFFEFYKSFTSPFTSTLTPQPDPPPPPPDPTPQSPDPNFFFFEFSQKLHFSVFTSTLTPPPPHPTPPT